MGDMQEVAEDVKDLGSVGVEVASTHAPVMVQRVTSAVGQARTSLSEQTAVIHHRANQRLHSAVHDNLVGPLRRVRQLLVMGVLLCWVLPLMCLRAYAPLNTAVANAGMVYVIVCLCRVQRRWRAKVLLLLWPLCTVGFPLLCHYCVSNPNALGALVSRLSPGRPISPQEYNAASPDRPVISTWPVRLRKTEKHRDGDTLRPSDRDRQVDERASRRRSVDPSPERRKNCLDVFFQRLLRWSGLARGPASPWRGLTWPLKRRRLGRVRGDRDSKQEV